MEELKRDLIKKHLEFEDLNGYFSSSAKYYAESGKASGSLFIALKLMMDEYVEELKKLSIRDVEIIVCDIK
jgi:hypothetical protein